MVQQLHDPRKCHVRASTETVPSHSAFRHDVSGDNTLTRLKDEVHYTGPANVLGCDILLIVNNSRHDLLDLHRDPNGRDGRGITLSHSCDIAETNYSLNQVCQYIDTV